MTCGTSIYSFSLLSHLQPNGPPLVADPARGQTRKLERSRQQKSTELPIYIVGTKKGGTRTESRKQRGYASELVPAKEKTKKRNCRKMRRTIPSPTGGLGTPAGLATITQPNIRLTRSDKKIKSKSNLSVNGTLSNMFPSEGTPVAASASLMSLRHSARHWSSRTWPTGRRFSRQNGPAIQKSACSLHASDISRYAAQVVLWFGPKQ